MPHGSCYTHQVRRLIVNADDFGLTGGINRAVVDLHRVGALTSATLMAGAPRFTEAVAHAAIHTKLGIGCHIVLVDGSPASDPDTISSLLVFKGPHRSAVPAFRDTLGDFVRDLYAGRIQPEQLEREAVAQIRALQKAGIRVTHVDTHKHTHMFPRVLQAVARAATQCGVGAIRNPFEPPWSIAATAQASLIRRIQVRILRGFEKNFRRTVAEYHFATTDGCPGVLATGKLNSTSLRSILSNLPDGSWELVCHPAYFDEELRNTSSCLLESRQIELEALQLLPELAHNYEIELVNFGALR